MTTKYRRAQAARDAARNAAKDQTRNARVIRREVEELRAENERLLAEIAAEEQRFDVLALNRRTDGKREWHPAGAWLYPGDAIVVVYGDHVCDRTEMVDEPNAVVTGGPRR